MGEIGGGLGLHGEAICVKPHQTIDHKNLGVGAYMEIGVCLEYCRTDFNCIPALSHALHFKIIV